MDRIFLSNMAFFARHGVRPEERTLGQRFFVDVDCYLDTRPAAAGDDYRRAVCYGDVYEMVRGVVTGEPVNLIETLAERIAEAVLGRFAELDGVRIAIRKPGAPIAGMLDHAGVEISRRRDPRTGPIGFAARAAPEPG